MFYAPTLCEYLGSAFPGARVVKQDELSLNAAAFAIKTQDQELLNNVIAGATLSKTVDNARTTREHFILRDIPASVSERQFIETVKEFYIKQGYEYKGLDAADMYILHKNNERLHANISFAHDLCYVTVNDLTKRTLPQKA